MGTRHISTTSIMKALYTIESLARYLSCSLLFLLVLTVAGCSTRKPVEYQEMSLTIRGGESPKNDTELERSSDLMYQFVAGQLSIQQEDYSKALGHLERAGNLSEKPSKTLSRALASLYIRQGELESALNQSNKILIADPGDSPALILKANILEALDRDAEALGILSKIPVRDSNYGLVDSIRLAAQQYRTGMKTDSEKTLRRFASNQPEQLSIQLYIAGIQELSGNLAEAEQTLRRAEEKASNLKSPEETATYARERFRLLLKLNKKTEARLVAKSLLRKDLSLPASIDPIDVARAALRLSDENKPGTISQLFNNKDELLFHLALLSFEQQDLTSAEQQLLILLARDPKNTRNRYYLASVQAALGLSIEAVKQLKSIPSDDPSYLQAVTFAVLLLRQQDKSEQAEALIREALLTHPTNRELRSHLVLVLREQKRNREARSLLSELIEEANTSDHELLYTYAATLHDLGEQDQAIEMMESILRDKPDYPDAMNFVAYALAEADRDLDRAIDLIGKALELKPNDGYYLDTLGWIYFKMGNYAEAEKHIEQAVDLTNNDIVILEHLGDVLLKTGKERQALSTYEKALKESAKAQTTDEQESLDRVRRKVADLQRELTP